ncbi:COX15/CtaA family protein [Eudoraea adriatica]|uniref:COX15/CtaA family protein n=1 Tax=Eudoraea adriatica TaxID=446681 RepID=UPI0003783E82|nr:COX15/CtaA family protein [Eudoraea adriatica]
MKRNFRSAAKITLVMVYLVIIAGAVVRMTGSGMGCPDWPKCFGYYIPPTDVSQLQWQPEFTYNAGQVIIREESLWVAKTDFTTENNYNQVNWEPYKKHDYAVFNALHTWIEFINRLFGAVAGIATLFLAIASISFWRDDKKITLISWLIVFGMGFQAWLGATVVYSVLEPVKITLHMVMALFIVALLVYLIYRSDSISENGKYDKKVMFAIWMALGLTLIQIILGTQVRQFIDHQIDILGENSKNLWLANPSIQFYIHRSFSILVVLVNLYIAYSIYQKKLGYSKINWVLGLLFIEVITGVVMYYFHFPFASQPLHLILAALLFGIQFYLVLEASKGLISQKTL